MGKKALLIYGPFTYVMEVPEFRDWVRIIKPACTPILKDYMRESDPVPQTSSYTQLIFQPVGFVDKDILMYRFVKEE